MGTFFNMFLANLRKSEINLYVNYKNKKLKNLSEARIVPGTKLSAYRLDGGNGDGFKAESVVIYLDSCLIQFRITNF